jgi:hypothetical protein
MGLAEIPSVKVLSFKELQASYRPFLDQDCLVFLLDFKVTDLIS